MNTVAKIVVYYQTRNETGAEAGWAYCTTWNDANGDKIGQESGALSASRRDVSLQTLRRQAAAAVGRAFPADAREDAAWRSERTGSDGTLIYTWRA